MLCLYIYETVQFGLVIFLGFASAPWTILYNTAEALLLFDKSRRMGRPPPWLYACLELTSMFLTATSGVWTLFVGFMEGTTYSHARMATAGAMNFGLAAMHLVFFFWVGECFGCIPDPEANDTLLKR